MYVYLKSYIPRFYQQYSPDIMFDLFTSVWNECVNSNQIQNSYCLGKLEMLSSCWLHSRVSSTCQNCP